MLVFCFVISDTDSLPCHIRTETSVLNRVCCLPPGPPAPGSLVLCTLPSCCTISCNVEIPIFCLLRSRNQGSWMGRGETGAFLLQETEKSSLLSEKSWLGLEGNKFAGFPELLEPTSGTHNFFSKVWLGKDQGSCWRQLSLGLGSRLLGMSSPGTWGSFAGAPSNR